MSENWDAADQRWADVAVVAEAVKRHLEVRAYLLTGGSDGCASCTDRPPVERVAAGHVECAENGIVFNAAKRLAAEASDFDLHIAIRQAFDDPRLFQWTETSR
jgi:hypothetical protein